MNTEQYIAKLLFDHDCVVIPGFGGFIGNYSSAIIQTVNHTFTPPYKSLLFNINLKQNDGLFANYLSLYEKISYDEAVGAIETMVNQWNSALSNRHIVEISGIGKLFRDHEGNLQFNQSMEVNYLSESYGLTSIVSPPIKRSGAQEKLGTQLSAYINSTDKKRRSLPRSMKWAAMLGIPLGTAALLGILNFEKIKSFSVNTAGILFPESNSVTIKENPTGKKTIIKPLIELKPIIVTPSLSASSEVKIEKETKKPFLIIVGAFRFRENAENLVDELRGKGYDASIEGQTKTGLFRVSMQSHNNKSEAIQQLAQLRTGQFQGAWLLIK